MTQLDDAFQTLTADQPMQPVDRLGAVTRKATRLRRTRASLSLAAVLAIGTPIGLALTQHSSHPSSTTYVGSAIADWPERSPATGRGVAQGALVQWANEPNHPITDVHWLFRGPVDVPGGARLYVVAWIKDGQVVTGFVERRGVDNQGAPLAEDGQTWQLTSAPALGDHVGMYLLRLEAPIDDNNWLFVLGDPHARTLRWTSEPLPYAPTSSEVVDHGRLTSKDGVFQGWSGKVTGPLTVAFDNQPATPTALSVGGTDIQLLRAPALSQQGSLTPTSGFTSGSGQLAFTHPSVSLDAGSSTGPAHLTALCYGGGRMTVLADEHVVGAITCDTTERTLELPSVSHGRTLQLRSDRQQVYRFFVRG